MEQRIKWLLFLFVLSFLAIFGRLFYWQVINRKHLLLLASSQYYSSRTVSAPRGKIFSKDNFPLVMNQKSYLLFADPQELSISPEELVNKVGIFINRENFDLASLVNKKTRWLPLEKNLSEEVKVEIERLKITGLGFEEGEKRFYPESSMSAHLLGFVGEDENSQAKGYFGLEGYYNQEVKGKAGQHFYEQDGLGRPMPLTEGLVEKPVAGRNLLLNLDRQLQFLVESRLKRGIDKYGASSGLVLVMDPHGGGVLALASFPNYDPSVYYAFAPELYRNPAVSTSFEPGSIFKILVMAAAIDSGVVKPEETCSLCHGPRIISGYTIKTWNEKYFPDSSMTDIIVHSDNVGMVWVAEKLGVTRLYDYLRKFGFGEETEIDLQGETSPSLREKESWREIDLATASFGQGIALTPIQFLTAVGAIANGGGIYQPQVVRKIFDETKTIDIKPIKKRRAISLATAQVIKEMMVQAVEKGEAKWARPKDYHIAGKTGTAQIPIAGHYDPEKTIASFVGFAPADNPRFVMLVMLTEPKTSPWGSETAAPLWFEIAKDIFKLWGIKPEAK